MGEDDKEKVNFKIKQRDWKQIDDLPCGKFTLRQWDVFEVMMSFCLSEKDKLQKHFEEWKKKQEK